MADRAAFDAYVRDRWVPLVRTAALLTGDRHAAEDLAQEALIRAAHHWHRVDPATADAYVRRILYTRSVDAWRWRRRQPDPAEPGPDLADRRDGASAADSRLTLNEALRRLTPRQRAVLLLRFYEDRTEAQTAVMLGCSVNTVKSQTRHALGRLRELAPELAMTFGREEAPR
ncbi:SigE family RNA polymerase sigma factor [uncultured Phycicoccus sp.]|uniref:SigE family RNA polymerase sigma factor n=1 Tax=uncultured Phycicoccus sp. TaxID=661422 RepID=UPI002629CAD7|nr:SigE family RNA polymerase sigma factor [uncultured Phycicoccus sp.]